eukprot:354921-Chlamydomonas_euryale.AAC.23
MGGRVCGAPPHARPPAQRVYPTRLEAPPVLVVEQLVCLVQLRLHARVRDLDAVQLSLVLHVAATHGRPQWDFLARACVRVGVQVGKEEIVVHVRGGPGFQGSGLHYPGSREQGPRDKGHVAWTRVAPMSATHPQPTQRHMQLPTYPLAPPTVQNMGTTCQAGGACVCVHACTRIQMPTAWPPAAPRKPYL